MEPDRAFRIVTKAIAVQFGVSESSITPATVAADVEGWDSFAHSQLVMAVERGLPRSLPVRPWLGARKVADLADLVRKILKWNRL